MKVISTWLRGLHFASPAQSNPAQGSIARTEPSDAQVKHLEFIQLVIARLGTNSFLAKGWALTVAGALYGFAVTHLNPSIALLGLVPVIAFWWLDSFFLRTERLYRCLYEDARKLGTTV